MMKITAKRIGYLYILAKAVAVSCASASADLERPKINMTDEFGVNITTGQVTASVDTVSIGGEMGLSHSITGYTNYFAFNGMKGYTDPYSGHVRYVKLGKDVQVGSTQTYDYFYVMRASGPGGTADFMVMVGDEIINDGARNITSNFRYQAIGDTRHILEVSGSNQEYLDWVHPDGTIYRHQRDSYRHASSKGLLQEIIYPNGRKVAIRPSAGVTTNTGYQIKYGFVSDHRQPTSETTSAVRERAITQDSNTWAGFNPGYYKAINTAVEYCGLDSSNDCSHLREEWPTATVLWPPGMPKAFYVGESDLKITNAEGAATVLHFRAYDLTKRNAGDHNDGPVDPGPSSYKWSPRLVGITPPGASSAVWTYDYDNNYYTESTTSGGDGGIRVTQMYTWSTSAAGLIKEATGPKGSASYSIGKTVGQHDTEVGNSASWNGKNHSAVVRVKTHAVGSVREIRQSGVGQYLFESHYRGFPKRATLNGRVENIEYEYDDRGNLEKVIEVGNVNQLYREAKYPETCPVSERRRCNKPMWVRDANGNQTDYEYYQFGGVKKVTEPADRTGVRPVTRYTYKQYRAYYYTDENGSLEAGDPIWLLHTESFCKVGSSLDSGCAASGAEVVTEYEYGPQDGSPNNLNLTGVAITADGLTRRTCYSYDIYGNRIGETRPKGNTSKNTCY